MKAINIKEFRKKGYLQELNRQFLHPLGLALSVEVDEKTGKEKLSKILDYRNNAEGVIYEKEVTQDKDFKQKIESIKNIQQKRFKKRKELLKYIIQSD